MIRHLALFLLISPLALTPAQARTLMPRQQVALNKAVAAPTRTAANRARDRYRHPAATLAFFGVRPTDTVVEIWPGGGWYSEILAPYVLGGGGKLYAAASDQGLERVRQLADAAPATYGKLRYVAFPAKPGQTTVPAGTADAVLTFRNVHNWMMGDTPFAEDAFRQMYVMLKPGGVLGIEEHRLPERADTARERKSGYVKASTVRRLAAAAGFKYVGTSEINANPKDRANWPEGVWTLPPTLTLKDKNRARYVAIGESDRMTLKFVKPR